jgi:SNF2 family DNA or RNA helicase
MRLTYENEDVTKLSHNEKNAVVYPFDVNAKYFEHNAKQAMAFGDLRRSKETLRFLINQHIDLNIKDKKADGDSCVVCLFPLEGQRSVLRCGHSFHSECFDRLRTHSHARYIECPLRCRTRTAVDDVMIAIDKSTVDGSRSKRKVNGSYGTKVEAIVGDVLDVRDIGEKSLIFSQWEDMLSIIEAAFAENSISYVRVKSLKQIGDCTKVRICVSRAACNIKKKATPD